MNTNELNTITDEPLEHYTDNIREFMDTESDEDINQATIDYFNELMDLQKEKKEFDTEYQANLKTIRESATDSGVEVVRVNAVVDTIKRKLKQSDDLYNTEKSIYDLLVKNNLANTIKEVI